MVGTANCPLCQRPIGNMWDKHHLIPRSRKGKGVVIIHKICHNKIHSVFTEKELELYYHTIERLLENEYIQTFVKWVGNKDPNYYETSKRTQGRRRKGKRR